ncbi:MAG: BspA family leucine-rich repeat surface protein, partial [Oscillospiraceae bacterium]|nr:BspA family leucine-rich repeat surface protein [Oscillospiraceae bacterium]
AKLTGGNGTAYDEAHTDGEYARIDAKGTPGYFTSAAGNPPEESCVSFDAETGTLTLHGSIIPEQVKAYALNNAVKKVVAADDAVLPADCSELFRNFMAETIDLTGADTSQVSDFSFLCAQCGNLTEVNLAGCDLSNALSMSDMFASCQKLTTVDFTGCKSTNVRTMSGMFRDCTALTELDLTGFATPALTDLHEMFKNCSALETVYASRLFDASGAKGSNRTEVFTGCGKLVGGNGTAYQREHESADYACVDLDSQQGYFTARQVLLGDVNNDGAVRGDDSILLQKYVNGWPDVNIYKEAADLNRDGAINTADAMILWRYIAGYYDFEMYMITIIL